MPQTAKMLERSNSKLLPMLVRGQMIGTVAIVVTTTHQLANSSSFSYSSTSSSQSTS